MKLRPAFIITTLGLLLSAANALASPGHKKDSIGQPGDGQAVDRVEPETEVRQALTAHASIVGRGGVGAPALRPLPRDVAA